MNRRQFLLGVSALGLSGITYSTSRIWPESGFSNPCLNGLPNELLEESRILFLQTLRHYNPLMFDFALKRLMKHNDTSFPASVFETKRFLLECTIS